jgi:hypothetical protein
MGQVTVKFSGSFGDSEASYSAEEGGHAYAISRAFYFLLSGMAKAIKVDHDLHSQNVHPDRSAFGTKAPKQ